MQSLSIVILAAGIGSRMKSKKPKVLQELCGKSLLQWVLSTTQNLSPQQINIVIGPDQQEIQDSLTNETLLQFGIQKERKGTGHAVQEIFSQISGDHVLVLCGDAPLVVEEDLQKLFQQHQENKSWASLISAHTPHPFGYGRILRNKENQLVGIVEEKDATWEEKALTEVNTGVYIFKYEALKEYLFQLKNENRQQEYYLTDLIGLLGKKGHPIDALLVDDFSCYQGVNSFQQLAQVRTVAQERILAQHMAAGVNIIDPRTTYIDAQVKIGANTQILPCCVLTGPVEIGESCVIGPFTHLRAGAILEEGAEIGNFTEVKKSTIGKKTKAKHLSYIGDSILGAHVNIGAGTITANYDGKKKHTTTIEDHAFIGSGTTLIAPVSVGKKSITGANSVVRQDVPAHTVVAGVPAKTIRKIEAPHE